MVSFMACGMPFRKRDAKRADAVVIAGAGAAGAAVQPAIVRKVQRALHFAEPRRGYPLRMILGRSPGFLAMRKPSPSSEDPSGRAVRPSRERRGRGRGVRRFPTVRNQPGSSFPHELGLRPFCGSKASLDGGRMRHRHRDHDAAPRQGRDNGVKPARSTGVSAAFPKS